MRILKRFASIIIIIVFLLQISEASIIFAATNPNMVAPNVIRVEQKYPDQPPIGYRSDNGGYYFDIKWTDWAAGELPSASGSITPYLNFYLKEIGKYNSTTSFIQKEKDVSRSVSGTGLRIGNLKSGTIYNIYSTAYYNMTNPDATVYKSSESAPSSTIKVLTDIKPLAYSSGPNEITVQWDDVWDVGKRIDYKLYVSLNKNFSGVEPMYIKKAQIGPNGPVVPDQATGTLIYKHTVTKPGTVYYVKVVPDISDPEIKKTPEDSPTYNTVAVSSYILATTTRMGITSEGTRWKLSWTPITTDLNASDIDVEYKIYRANSGSTNLPVSVASVKGKDNTNYFFTLSSTDPNDYYYYILAKVTWKNTKADVYPIEIKSDNITVKEPEVPSTPATPEIVPDFRRIPTDTTTTIISYAAQLTGNSATILWKLPKNGQGGVDTDVAYDIWLISDPNLIDNPIDNNKIASNLKMTGVNEVKDGSNLVGYKYVVQNLTPNSTYYFKVVAKKSFVVLDNGILKNKDFPSSPALKVIITPASGPIDKPLVPNKPPLKIKKAADGKNMVTDQSVVIQIKNKWYESFNDTTGKWEYLETVKDSPTDTTKPDVYDLVNDRDKSVVDAVYTRDVIYDSGVTIDVGCVEFTDGIDITTEPTDKITGVPTNVPAITYVDNRIYNPDESEDPLLNPDHRKHNIDIKISDLKPNTTYILWVKANRVSVANSESGPSDPIIITTNPQLPPTVEKPIVPDFNYVQAGDSFADFGWAFKPGYKYYIKYGKVDDVKAASGQVTITNKEYINYYRFTGLTPNTLYYFFIQAEATNGNLSSKSEWSDSTPVKTLPFIPPTTPRGFGVKSPMADNVTKNTITFEWLKEDNMEYIIQVASGVDYKDVKEYKAGSVSEYTVSDLRSNFRYFAKLYAFDPKKNLRSDPTQSVTVRTLRSSDDFDSDQDVENVISGDYVVKDPTVIGGKWNIKIIGVNADRLIQKMQEDKVLDYILDATLPPSAAPIIVVTISNKLFDSLSRLNENITIATDGVQITIRPGMLDNIPMNTQIEKLTNFNYEITIASPSQKGNPVGDNMTFKTNVIGINFNVYNGGNVISISSFNKPMKVGVPYTDVNWYKQDVTSGFQFSTESDNWNKLSTTNKYNVDTDIGFAYFESSKPGNVVIADTGSKFYDDTLSSQYESAITNVQKVHQLNSLDGRKFEPDKTLTIGDGIKFMLDCMDSKYGNEFMATGLKSGFILNADINSAESPCTRQKAIVMVVRLYEIKTKEMGLPKTKSSSIYSDLKNVDAVALPKVNFAIENGLIENNSKGILGPKEQITRGEIIGMLEKMLALIGEIG